MSVILESACKRGRIRRVNITEATIFLPAVHNDTANNLVEKYIFHSCLYYVWDESLISDYEFDMMGRKLKSVFHLADCQHKELIEKGQLTVTGCYIKSPTMCMDLCEFVANNIFDVRRILRETKST